MAVAQIRVCGRTLHLREHAVERYHERVRPALTLEQATAELLHVIEFASWTRVRPEWHKIGDAVADRPTDAWLLLGDGVAFPVHGNSIVTCVTNAGGSPATRERRAERRRARTPSHKRQNFTGKVRASENARWREQRDRLP